MADWRIVTPTREPEDDEINTPSGMAPGNGYVLLSPGNFTILCGSSEPRLAFKIQNVQPVVTYYYNFTEKTWLDSSLEHIDITTVDLTIPEAAITGATVKTSYFDLIAFEKGTTACKLAVTNEAKTLIRNALINKGVDVPDTTPFRQYAGKVGEIQSGQSFEWKTQTGVSGYAQINSEVMPLAGPPVYSYDLDLSDNQEYNAVFLVLEETYYSTGDLRPVGAFYINGTWKAELITLTDKSSKSHLSFEDYGGYGKVYFVPMVLPNV